MVIDPQPWTTPAVVFAQPGRVALEHLRLDDAGPADVLVEIDSSGVSTGTERLLWSGRMPVFPGMGYPLVPGYESVGTVVHAGPESSRQVGERVFVPGAKCFCPVRGLFGGSARRLVVPAARTVPLDPCWGDEAILLALAATAFHACSAPGFAQPDLIVGHGVLGRLLARLAVAAGAQPVVWETNAARSDGAQGYTVLHPDQDTRRDYRCICDASGDAALLDSLIGRLTPGGEIVLAGFYDQPISFAFPPAFQREARLRIAAQWQPEDMRAVTQLVAQQRLDLQGLITHRVDAPEAQAAYQTAFTDPACLKMVLDWRNVQ